MKNETTTMLEAQSEVRELKNGRHTLLIRNTILINLRTLPLEEHRMGLYNIDTYSNPLALGMGCNHERCQSGPRSIQKYQIVSVEHTNDTNGSIPPPTWIAHSTTSSKTIFANCEGHTDH